MTIIEYPEPDAGTDHSTLLVIRLSQSLQTAKCFDMVAYPLAV